MLETAGKMILACSEENEKSIRRFSVRRMISDRGASAVCYEAVCDGGRGVLKAFRPRAPGADGKTRFAPGTAAFRAAEERYLSPYREILRFKRDGADLSSFIPPFEILRECGGHGGEAAGAALIWMPVPEFVTFERVCRDVRRHPFAHPQRSLALILKSIRELTECVLALHKEGILHRDIQPENFGFLTRSGSLLEQTLSLFDLDSLCSTYDVRDAMGTPGYMAPEGDAPDVRSDVYSIGATLYHALIFEESGEGTVFQDADFTKIRERVDASVLIRACDANAHPYLRHKLTEILQRCLCARDGRYRSCIPLLRDLDEALSFLMPVRPAAGGKWIWKDAAARMDRNRGQDARLAMQVHLYLHPLYRYAEGTKLRVAVLGFGSYGQKFLDICLGAGQILGKELEVTVVSGREEDRAIYLEERPALPRFFDVDGSLRGDPERYGEIRFLRRNLTVPEKADQARPDEESFSAVLRKGEADYVFVALGDDGLNLSAARLVRRILGKGPGIAYIREEEGGSPAGDLMPVEVSARMRRSRAYQELMRMAFNAHLVWEKQINVDFIKAREDFLKPYNLRASMDSVLSVKTKLYGFGIDVDRVGAGEAAVRLMRLLQNPGSETLRLRTLLAWLEHRRWVTAMICDGWETLDDLSACARNGHRDKAGKRHACIVRSRPDFALREAFYTDGAVNRAKWDGNGDDGDTEGLDELDRLSVRLHRACLSAARKQKERNPLRGPAVQQIGMIVRGCEEAEQAWREFHACLQDILRGEPGRAFRYEALKRRLLAAASGFDETRRQILEGQTAVFERIFHPILASAEYQDFKEIDAEMIDQIPFILTYAAPSVMAIPMRLGSSSAVFSNVAAPTQVNPTDILYLYHCASPDEPGQIVPAAASVCEYIRRKNLRAEVEMLLTAEPGALPRAEEFHQALFRACGATLRRCEITEAPDRRTAAEEMARRLSRRKNTGAVFALEQNESPVSWLLEGAGLYRRMAWYRYNAARMVFSSAVGCEMFGAVPKRPVFTVSDMAAFRGARYGWREQPAYLEGCREIREMAREGGGGEWKALCALLRRHAEEADTLAVFRAGGAESRPEVLRYRLPGAACAAAEKLIGMLREERLLDGESGVRMEENGTCALLLRDRFGNRNAFHRLFRDPSRILSPEDLRAVKENGALRILADGLLAENAGGGAISPAQTAMLRALEARQVLLCLEENSGSVSFSYASREAKRLLTDPDRILTRYVCDRLKNSGLFDDVMCDYEIGWPDAGVAHVFDCVATRGFSSVFIECSAGAPDLDRFYKLSSLVSQFGVNARAVWVADTACDAGREEENRRRIADGERLGITVISDAEQIGRIDEAVLRILADG